MMITLNRFKKMFQKKKAKDNIQLAIEKIDNVNPHYIRSSIEEVFSSVKIPSYFINIDQYKLFISGCLDKLNREQLIDRNSIPSSVSVLPISKFYTDKNGFYLDIYDETVDFLSVSKLFLTALSHIKDHHEESITNDRSMLYLQHVLNNLLVIIDQLDEILIDR